jgi:hypothetical protein
MTMSARAGSFARVHLKRLRVLAVMAACALVGAVASAATLTWPTGAAPCDDINDLETCIVTGAASGDVVEIAANAIPSQSVSVSPGKSFTLRPADGYTPVFASFSTISAFGGDADITVAIEGLTIQSGRILLRQGGEGTFDVTVRNNVIQQTATFGNAIGIDSGNVQPPYGPTLFLVEGNTISISVAADDQVSAISVGGFQGGGNVGSIVDNVIHQVGGDQNGAIDMGNGSVTLTVDVIGNQISGANFNEGVGIFQFADGGSVIARIINNTITGQVDEAGAPAGVSLNVSQGSADFTVINNTVAYNETGVLVNGRSDLGASISGILANNIIAFNTDFGLSIDDDFGGSFSNEYNLVHGNSSDYYTPGPGTITHDPRLLGPDDFRLEPTSPARNAGTNARLPGDITTDVVGNPRIQQAVVDMGAFEDQRQGEPGIPALSPWGLVVLALAIALGAAAALRASVS